MEDFFSWENKVTAAIHFLQGECKIFCNLAVLPELLIQSAARESEHLIRARAIKSFPDAVLSQQPSPKYFLQKILWCF